MKGYLLLMGFALAGCTATYPYLVANDKCDCLQYSTKDDSADVLYILSAEYSVDDGVTSRITVQLQNNTRDTLDMSQAYIKVTSRNIPYRYNDKFLPIHIPFVLPRDKETLVLVGESLLSDSYDPWLSIAGEELLVTLKGLKVGQKELRRLAVRLVPVNPRFVKEA